DLQAGSVGSIEIFRARSGKFFSVKVCPEFFNQDPITNFLAGSDAFFPHARSSERHIRIQILIKVRLKNFKQGLLKSFQSKCG
ncbi:MAG: hypothetical protein Q7U51_15970, partial [Methanoregula sp.]|nr:hypothetical protein [Methanoregula sp.]